MKRIIHRIISLLLAAAMLIPLLPSLPAHVHAAEATPESAPESTGFEGKKVSILSHSMSTYAGVSNNTNANSTIGSNDVYYTEGKLGVYQKDTWWQQAMDALGMELLVNNSWSGSCVFQPRKGAASVGYGDRAVNLHNDRTGEEPDIIWVYLGCNDFAYYKDTFGKAEDVDYSALICAEEEGAFTYATPTTTCEAYAIMLHKVTTRYPEAQVYCITSTARRDPDYADNYADTGQPTAYSAELHKVAQHFGFPVVDLEGAIPKEADLFDQYIGDKRAHCNPLGMDKITEAVLSVMLGTDAEIRHVTSPQGIVAEQAVLLGGSYRAEAELADGYSLAVTMDGKDVTAEVCKDGTITIEEVTGDIHVETVISRDPRDFRWVFQDDILTSVGTSENNLTKLSGTVTNSILNDGIFQLNTSLLLKHDLPWTIEWKCAEDWRGAMLVSHEESATKGMTYLTRTKGGQLCFGTYTGSQYDNYGIDISYLDSETHSYRLENRIAEDGSNMVWLYLDGVEVGPMNNYFIGSKDQNTTSNWVSGKDFVFSFIGMTGHTLRNCQLDYLSVTECDHTYKNGICTNCDAEHPNLTNFEGKVISILGDSASTFAGYIPAADGFNLAHRARYPDTSRIPDVTDVNQTWWMQVVTALGAKLGINDSWAGSQVLNTGDTNSGDLGPDVAMASLTRIQNLGSNGTPDVILFYGAGNDIGRAVPLGEFKPATAPQTVDLSTKKWDTFADAYVAAILRLKHFYPDSAIVVMLYQYIPSYFTNAELDEYNSLIQSVCDHYNIPTIDLRNSGVTADMLPDNVHPNAEGMDLITKTVLDALIADCTVTPGENVVYSISHELVNATASKHYYKGVSAGSKFSETVTGENVTVTMAGIDITSDCYSNGMITIPEVTGDIVITARGEFNADGHLQQLPDVVCSDINLWNALKPENIYYTVNGWGNVSAGTAWSITFPVQAGDQIWATSFGKSGENGDTANGVRITWFDENGVLATVDRNTVYTEFVANGYITAPEGALALNVTMASNNPNFKVYILNRDHTYKNGICTACGGSLTNPDLGGHLQQLPKELCAGVNLWTALTPENIYYTATGWGNTTAGTTWSITFPVQPGQRIWATSLGATPGNGSAANGVRITWFDENGVLATLDRNTVYSEFAKNGYITVPEGAVALNLPMTNNQSHYAVYILSAEHSYTDDICTVCGGSLTNPDLGDHLQQLPEQLCAGTNLWTALTPENIYYLGTEWGLYTSAPNVHSVTFPVEVGERIWATSFGKTSSGTGTRITWFSKTGVLESVSRDVVYAEFIEKGYITVPEGAIAVNIPMGDASKDREIYLLDRAHRYTGTSCSICGAANPDPAKYAGKVISILSASTSTFAGYIPVADGFNLEHRPRYPQDNLLTDVNETWWMQVINDLDAKLGINDSWAGSTVSNFQDTNSGDLGPDACMASLTRIQNLGANGSPDVILFFGAGNDIGRGVTMGSFDPATAPTEVDLTATKWDTFADAYVAAIMRLQYFYPDAEIIAMTTYAMPSYATAAKLDKYGPIVKAICDHYGVKYVDLRNCGVTADMLPDKIHPNAEGMDHITAAVLDTLLNEVEMTPGENVVYSVTHELSGAAASRHYYKGVSAGEAFVETVSGKNVTVTVTMDGVDITSQVYTDGTISIPCVTGDLVITATGIFDADGHLQQLPENICAGTNLWTALTPENIYYTATGWGNNSNSNYSVTFPVSAGDRIWASSFGASGTNGYGDNAVRITWFAESGVLASIDRDTVYAEFSEYGYITVPEGAIAVNIPMASNATTWEIYIQTLPHTYKSTYTEPTCTEAGYVTHICTTCGDTYTDGHEPALGHSWDAWQQIAEENCQGQGRWMRSCETCAAAQYTTDQDGSCVSFNSPAILANSGDTVVLTYYDVALDADTVADAATIAWSSEQLAVEQGCVTPTVPGMYTLIATSGTVSKTVYLVVKAPESTEYVLYFDDFTDAALPGYRPIEVHSGAQYYVSDGKLILDTSNSVNSYIRLLLPEWIGDFGDYEIRTTFTITEALDSTKWFAVMARVQDEDVPYLQAPVRFNATAANGIELDQKNADNTWVILHKTSYTETISPSKYYTQTFGLSGTTGYHAINGTTLLESDAMAYGPGDVGFQVRGAVASIDCIKIVIPVDTAAHTLGDWVVTSAPTCTEPGTGTRSCSVCGYTETREVDPCHDLVQHAEKMPTCTESGWLAYETCTRCDYSTLVEVAPTGHSYHRLIHSVAHRGYSQTAPENTLAAYKLAKEKGYFYVECDVAFTADGIPVLLHDDTIDRTSDGTGKVSELTYEQLLQYDFGSWKNSAYTGTSIPTFEEFIALCVELDLHPYIELKRSGSYTQAKVQQLVDIVEAYGMTGKVTWISFSSTFLGYVKNADPTARLGYIFSGDATESVLNTAKKLQTGQNEVFLCLNYSKITNAGVLRAATNDFAVEVWTVNSKSAILALPAYVSGVISDGYHAQNIIDSNSTAITEPTCTQQGYTTHTCAACGDSYVDSYAEPTGQHSYENGLCTGCGIHLPGDINGDGLVNNKDITRLFQYLSDYDVEVVEEALDTNGDGSVNNKDLTRLFQYLSDYEVELY